MVKPETLTNQEAKNDKNMGLQQPDIAGTNETEQQELAESV